MKKHIIKLDIYKYIERGILYRGFKPFEASRKEVEEESVPIERFVQVQDNISFQNESGEESTLFFGDYLNITDFEHPYGVSQDDFANMYSVCDESSKKSDLCKVYVKSQKKY